MKVLITGKGGKAGSWQIRAVQLGAALGATVQPMVSVDECRAASVIVVVKRTPPRLIDAIRQSGRPWVLDLVDGWPQPCVWSEGEAINWLTNTLQALKPAGVVFGTEQMHADSGYRGRAIVLPHHSWSRYLQREPVERNDIRTVGYEGSPAYLGRWRRVIERECAARGWVFDINSDMTAADIGIALRDGGGYPARQWKPGTKLSNLHALGIPALCSIEAGYLSVASGGEYWVNVEGDVADAFDRIESADRTAIAQQMRAAAIDVGSVASKYRQWLEVL